MQLRFQTGLTGEDYVTREGWRLATLPRCPVHTGGGCGFSRHGTYRRVSPAGTRVARWYCRQAHRTFSLLPDHLAARMPGSLQAIEEVVASVERSSSLESAADRLRGPEITLPSAVIGLLPDRLLGCAPRIGALRERLGCTSVLVRLRASLERYLHSLASPLGFRPPSRNGGERKARFQQHMGPDPPEAGR